MRAHDKLVILMWVVLGAALCGFVAAIFTARMSMSGRVSLALLSMPLLSIFLAGVDFGGGARELLSAVLFAFGVPVCVFYSFHALRRAPDRRVALAGFVGSVLFGIGYVILMPMLLYELIRLIAN